MFLEYVQKYLFKVVTIVLQIVILAMLIRFFVISPALIDGQSMEDTLFDNDVVLVYKALYLARPPERFEIVKATRPDNDIDIIKRIVGLPGETVILKNKKIFIKDRFGDEYQLEEPYQKGIIKNEFESSLEIFVPEHHYFIIGDNREFSIDSRNFGPVHRRFIEGKVLFASRWREWFN